MGGAFLEVITYWILLLRTRQQGLEEVLHATQHLAMIAPRYCPHQCSRPGQIAVLTPEMVFPVWIHGQAPVKLKVDPADSNRLVPEPHSFGNMSSRMFSFEVRLSHLDPPMDRSLSAFP